MNIKSRQNSRVERLLEAQKCIGRRFYSKQRGSIFTCGLEFQFDMKLMLFLDDMGWGDWFLLHFSN